MYNNNTDLFLLVLPLSGFDIKVLFQSHKIARSVSPLKSLAQNGFSAP